MYCRQTEKSAAGSKAKESTAKRATATDKSKAI